MTHPSLTSSPARTPGLDAPLLHVSEEPIVNTIHRRLPDVLLGLFVLILVYMCFVPFDLVRIHSLPRGPGYFAGLKIAPLSMRDIFSNLALYTLLAALFCATLRRREVGRFLAILAAVTFSTILSVAVEYGQLFVLSRVSSWIDVCANGLGAALGAIGYLICESWLRTAARVARSDARHRWWLAVCKAFVCMVLVVNLRPYDVAVDVVRTGAHLRETADFHPLAAWRALNEKFSIDVAHGRVDDTGHLARMKWEYAVDRLVDILTYAAMAALVVVGLDRSGSRRWADVLYAGCVTGSVAAIIALIRAFLISHGFDASHLYCALIGWAIGGLLAVACRAHSLPNQRSAFTVSGGVAVACLGLVALYELLPFDFSTLESFSADRICLMPFKAHFNSKPNVAFYDLSGDALRYAAVGAAIAWLLRLGSEKSWRRQLLATMLLSTGAASFFEFAHLFMPSRHADVTTLLLAAMSSLAGAVALRWVCDIRRTLGVVVADDLLTRQLIEGATYQPLPSPADAAAPNSKPKVAPRITRPGYDDDTT